MVRSPGGRFELVAVEREVRGLERDHRIGLRLEEVVAPDVLLELLHAGTDRGRVDLDVGAAALGFGSIVILPAVLLKRPRWKE
jgi:hypothetical protein